MIKKKETRRHSWLNQHGVKSEVLFETDSESDSEKKKNEKSSYTKGCETKEEFSYIKLFEAARALKVVAPFEARLQKEDRGEKS